MEKDTDGFNIIHEAGAKYSWTYNVKISLEKDKLYVSKTTKVCLVNGKKESITHQYHISPDKLNVVDTLNADCNCDKVWNKLEKN